MQTVATERVDRDAARFQKYYDETFEYRCDAAAAVSAEFQSRSAVSWMPIPFFCLSRHVILPSDISEQAPVKRLMSEEEWRSLGVQQSRGWVHYAIHKPEPHVLLFRREHHGNRPTC